MTINVKTENDITVVEISGELNAGTVPDAQGAVLPLAGPGCKIVLDLAAVPFMSSAGLRLMLVLFRTVKSKGGKILLAGLADEIKSTMSLTGFLDFFDCRPTRAEAVSALS
jgi:anti-sigma B factor antagonist